MSTEREWERMGDMLLAAEKVLRFTGGMDFAAFEADERTQYAVIALLEILGEAANKAGITFRNAHREIPWRALIGMRNHLIHGYDTVDLNIVWTAITQELPGLIPVLKTVLGQSEN